MIGFLSHEVRNPQAAMSMSIDCLLHDAERDPALLSADHVRVIEGLRANSEFVTALLDDVLNMQRISQGLLKIEKSPFALGEFVLQLQSNFSHLLQKKRHKFIVSLDPCLPIAVLGDRHRIRQILSNFITNAVKFTPEGGSIELLVAVIDTSTTISSESMPPCPAACDSTFVGTLPSLRLNAASSLKVATPEFSKTFSASSVLFSSQATMWIQFSVRDTGIGISAADQEKLFQAYSQIQAGLNQSGGGAGLGLNICKGLADLQGGSIGVCSVPHVGSEFFIVLPLQVSDMSYIPPSFSASNSRSSLFVPDGLRQRSQVSSDSAKSSLQVHGSDAVSPVLPVSLPATSSVIASSSSMSPLSVPALCTRRVLIVEDNVFIRQLLARLLSQFGYDSDWVENGRAAVERLAPLSDSDAKQSSPPFDLVLMDHLMPEMNGDEAIRLLRLRGFRRPIVGLTGNAAGAERDVLLAAGACRVLSKPVKADVLKQCLADAPAL
jgi:signal transduction histidine kinase/CheY-like chemotaxis protein